MQQGSLLGVQVAFGQPAGGLRHLLARGSELETSALPPRPTLGRWASRRAVDENRENRAISSQIGQIP